MRVKQVGSAIENRRGEVEAVVAAGAQYFAVTGEIAVDGVGGATVDVLFPVYFVAKPSFSFGGELEPGYPISAGQLPTANLCVIAWNERRRADQSTVYSGASFSVVTTGTVDSRFIVQWHMDGIGLRSPYDDEVEN